MTNKATARILKQTAELIELTGGNPFRARAFQRAARTLERLDRSVEELADEGRLTEIDGIGQGLAAQITEILVTGSFEVRDELQASLPPGLLDLLDVKGLGAKRVRQLWKELGITSLDELEEAATIGRLTDLDGFGPKLQKKILLNVVRVRGYQSQRRYADALSQAQPLLQALASHEAVSRVSLAGSLRRACETVERIDLVAATTDPSGVQAHLSPLLAEGADFHEADVSYVEGSLPDGLPVRVACVPPEHYGSALWRWTGAKAHVAAFAERHGTPAPAAQEEQVYAQAGLAFIPPAVREGHGELDAAADGALPPLITVDDLRGNLHNHSTYSDGAHSLQAMAEAARQRGYAYFGICDHSRSLKIANGMPVERVREQQAEIDALNAAFAADDGAPFRIFKGIESDILSDGSLDYPEEVLASFDFVVASIHTGFSMTETEATDRLISAVHNPYTTILGHPTGRLLLAREGYPVDHERVIEACAEAQVAIELNANPYRLDLDWRWIRSATARGVLIAINPDAHAIDQLDYVRWGVAAARKGWLTADQCLNAKPLDDFAAWLDQRAALVRS